MDAVVLAVVIGAFVCGGVLLEGLASHLPALLGFDRSTGGVDGGHGTPRAVRTAASSDGELEHLERRMDELRAERDFYKALAEPGTAAVEADTGRGRP